MRYQLVALEGLKNSYCNNLSSRHLFDLVFCRQIQQFLIYNSKTFYRKFKFYFFTESNHNCKNNAENCSAWHRSGPAGINNIYGLNTRKAGKLFRQNIRFIFCSLAGAIRIDKENYEKIFTNNKSGSWEIWVALQLRFICNETDRVKYLEWRYQK